MASPIRPLCQIRIYPSGRLPQANRLPRASLCASSNICVRFNVILSFTPFHHLCVAAMTCNHQIVYPGLGKNYMSPERPGCHVKNQLLVSRPGQQSKRDEILKRIHKLDEKTRNLESISSEHTQDVFDTPAADSKMDWEDESVDKQDEPAEHHHNIPTDKPKRHRLHNHKADILNQYKAWKDIIPSLVEPLLSYISMTSAGTTPQVVDIPECSHCDGSKISRVMCLFWDRK
jgi:hypothetical protein